MVIDVDKMGREQRNKERRKKEREMNTYLHHHKSV
jgi:hypothetical protein